MRQHGFLIVLDLENTAKPQVTLSLQWEVPTDSTFISSVTTVNWIEASSAEKNIGSTGQFESSSKPQ